MKALPDSIRQYKADIEKTLKDRILISLESSNTIGITDSKIGGIPYLPTSDSYPLDSDGKPMNFLAQINFAQTPKLAKYPESGILQFFIANDDLYGLQFDSKNPLINTEQKGFKVVYYEDITTHQTFESPTSTSEEDMTPLDYGYQFKMKFSLDKQPVTINHFKIENILATLDFDNDTLYDAYSDYSAGHHQIGGYPNFTQNDPRYFTPELKDYELLFQLETAQNIMWGDSGVGNFFIKPEDLKNKDFSKVLYNWDCC